MIKDLIKEYPVKQIDNIGRPRAKGASSDRIEFEMRKEDLSIGVDMLWRADEAVILVFM